jgi:hypothetical protein
MLLTMRLAKWVRCYRIFYPREGRPNCFYC